jgi:hypothetical protein
VCAHVWLCTAQLPRGWLQVDPPMTLQSNSKPAEGSHPCIQHLETSTWNCWRFRERRKRLGENINASREHMTMTPQTLRHQLVKPQSKSKQRRILTAHTHSTRISREEFLLSCCKAQPCKPPRTESTWSGPKLQSLLGEKPYLLCLHTSTILRPKDRIIWCGASFNLDH